MIYGERIRLRAVEHGDLPRFVEWLNDPDVSDGLSLALPLSMADEEAWFENHRNLPPEEKSLVIEIKDGDDWHMVGNSSFMHVEHAARAGEIGLFIGDKSVWGQGYGLELVRLLLQHGFETLNLNRIYLRVHENNQRAIHIYEKAGFVHEGRMRQAVYKHGRYEALLFMSVLRSEWDSKK